jgi:FkbM family methyltransferase
MDATGEIFQQAFKAHKSGNLKDAESGYHEVLAAEPDHPSALHLLGLIAFDSGEIGKAIPLIEKSVQLVPKEFQWQLNYGKILSQAQEFDEAISAYQKALLMHPESLEGKMSLGSLYFEVGNFSEALSIFYKILINDPTDDTAKAKYGEILKAMGKGDEAESFLHPSTQKKILNFKLKDPHPDSTPNSPEKDTQTLPNDFQLPSRDNINQLPIKKNEHHPQSPAGFAPSSSTPLLIPHGKLDAISECAFLADALYRIGCRESAHFYAHNGLIEMINGKIPDIPIQNLLDSWNVSTPGALFARMWVEHVYSLCYVLPRDAEIVLKYWCKQEPKNSDPFLRLGLLLFLNAAREDQSPPEEAREVLRNAHHLCNNERSALALQLLESGTCLNELIIPYDQAQIFVYPDIKNNTTYVLLEQGDWFEDTIHLFRALIKPGDTVLDLGANVGVYSISAAQRVGATGKVFSIEPSKKTFSFLNNSAKQFENIHAINCAVSDIRGKGILEHSNDPELMRLRENEGAGEVVDITTVDELAKHEGVSHFDIIKIDVEGAEEKVIAGAKILLADTSPIIFYEVAESGFGLAKLFESFDYESYYYCAPRKALIRYHEGDQIDSFVMNLIAMRKTSLDRFDGIVTIE